LCSEKVLLNGSPAVLMLFCSMRWSFVMSCCRVVVVMKMLLKFRAGFLTINVDRLRHFVEMSVAASRLTDNYSFYLGR